MSVILDIAALGYYPDAERKVADYLAKGLGGSESISSKWIDRNTDLTSIIPAAQAATIEYIYPYESAEAVFSKKRFFCGYGFLSFYLVAISGTWELDIAIDNTGLGSDNSLVVRRRLYYASNVVNTPVANQMVHVAIPFVPFLRISVQTLTGAASGFTIRADAQFNGLFFEIV